MNNQKYHIHKDRHAFFLSLFFGRPTKAAKFIHARENATPRDQAPAAPAATAAHKTLYQDSIDDPDPSHTYSLLGDGAATRKRLRPGSDRLVRRGSGRYSTRIPRRSTPAPPRHNRARDTQQRTHRVGGLGQPNRHGSTFNDGRSKGMRISDD